MHFSQIKASDLILCNHIGEVVEGDYPVNRARLPEIIIPLCCRTSGKAKCLNLSPYAAA
ncbi:hypothetical protein [Neobacillus muris]|uniref:hypothetical protein n=1 Tax=Neobacillus muris TaxID=2941334 RepID=UPI00203F4810|nr:hypothetical protein [Neobacillus muris]